MNTPILFLIFNRPDLTARSFETIRLAKPTRLFIAADGPRTHIRGESENCHAARKITETIDWDCEVFRLYRESNFGCRLAISEAVTWFFDQVDEGIVLEDDCVPVNQFFSYCSELLHRFRNDERVYMISGSRQSQRHQCNDSYTLSRWGSVWGWASWKRAWKHYDVDMTSWRSIRGKLAHALELKSVSNFLWRYSLYQSDACSDTWDYQWTYTRQKHSSFTVIPRFSLVNNIGFDARATHTTTGQDLFCRESSIAASIEHPASVKIDIAHDRDLECKSRHYSRELWLPRTYLTISQFAKAIGRRFQRSTSR